MRRQTIDGGAMPAASSCKLQLDPTALPVRFTAPDAVADGQVRLVEIDRDRVLLSRSVRGMAVRVRVPMQAFRGVSARAVAATEGPSIVLTLEHADPALSIDVFAAPDESDAVAEWQLWGRILGLPLLVADQAGHIRQPAARQAAGLPCQRRRKRNAIARRRPRLPLRRKPGCLTEEAKIYREREIIARD